MINEISILQIFIIINSFYILLALNILTLWYVAGIYLILLGLSLLLDDGDIFIGFLWIIDLGVGLIFFIFILHFSNFLHNKIKFDAYSAKFYYIIFISFFLFLIFYFFNTPINNNSTLLLYKSWFFFISWYDYYDLYFIRHITDLNLLREIYYYNNSFEFFLINFLIMYGIFLSILLTFLIKKIFSFTSSSQLKNFRLLTLPKSTFFIRNQNFIKQQNTSTGLRVWKKKKLKKNDL
jgi:hypothetical protein